MKDTFDFQNSWRCPGYIFPKEPYIQRNVFAQLFKDLSQKEITVVVGSRQVGKNFLIKKRMPYSFSKC
jgi:predicted AAA+ superfamily ATPase